MINIGKMIEEELKHILEDEGAYPEDEDGSDDLEEKDDLKMEEEDEDDDDFESEDERME